MGVFVFRSGALVAHLGIGDTRVAQRRVGVKVGVEVWNRVESVVFRSVH